MQDADHEQIHSDDISNVLILNKKATTSQENQLFKSELEKFRPHQNRILQAMHKQSAIMKELTRTYGDLLQDKRVRSEQNKYESFSRQRNTVLSRYRKVYQAYVDLNAGLERARQFYSEMKETVESLEKNVQSFVENRRSEGSQLLNAIEAAKGTGADREQTRLKELMERMSVNPSPLPHSNSPSHSISSHRPPPLQPQVSYGSQQQSMYNPTASPPATPQYQNGVRSSSAFQGYQPPPSSASYRQDLYPSQSQTPRDSGYNPSSYGPVSPPAHQQYFSPPPGQQGYGSQPTTTQHGYGQQQHTQPQHLPPGWHPPPPPPGPPPSQDYSSMQATNYPSGPGGYASDPRRSQQGGNGAPAGDPWAGLSGWK